MSARLRILVLGASGMLGHAACREFTSHHDVLGTVREGGADVVGAGVLEAGRVIEGVDATRFESVVGTIARTRPNVILNCVGIVKQAPEAKDPVLSLEVNALLPHRLQRLAAANHARLIHISTDCVFSGRRGNYCEDDVPDAEDLYGKTKFLGEVAGNGCLTIRTSIIGRELRGRRGLLEWFLHVSDRRVPGYVNALFSGFTTAALARILRELIERHSGLSGLYHVASQPISKYDLLVKLRAALRPDVEVIPELDFHCDRTLDARRFRTAAGLSVPTWDTMVAGLATNTPVGSFIVSSREAT